MKHPARNMTGQKFSQGVWEPAMDTFLYNMAYCEVNEVFFRGEEEHKVKTQVPQWKTVFTAVVVLVAVIIIASLENDVSV